MVRDGYFYGLALVLVAAAVYVATHSFALCVIPLALAAFFLWFFRDPERPIPEAPGLIVSPADGKVTSIATIMTLSGEKRRVSIFLSVFDVHVNRSPIAGTVQSVFYRRGKFLNALNPASADENEQNSVDVVGELCTVSFRQIAGLLARRIVFDKRQGDWVHRGERVGMIKFGSRVDVLFPLVCEVKINVGDRVHGGATVLAAMPFGEPVALAAEISSEMVR